MVLIFINDKCKFLEIIEIDELSKIKLIRFSVITACVTFAPYTIFPFSTLEAIFISCCNVLISISSIAASMFVINPDVSNFSYLHNTIFSYIVVILFTCLLVRWL